MEAQESGSPGGISGSLGQITSQFIQRLRRQEPCRAAKCPKNMAKWLLLRWKGCVQRYREQGLESKEGTRKRGKGTVGKGVDGDLPPHEGKSPLTQPYSSGDA